MSSVLSFILMLLIILSSNTERYSVCEFTSKISTMPQCMCTARLSGGSTRQESQLMNKGAGNNTKAL